MSPITASITVVVVILALIAIAIALFRTANKRTNQAAPIKKEEFVLQLSMGTAIIELPAVLTSKDKERILTILDGIADWPEGQKHVMGR